MIMYCRVMKENTVFRTRRVFIPRGIGLQLDLVVRWLVVDPALKEHGDLK